MMAANSDIQFKVFLRNEGNSETKRFFVDSSAVTCFVFMKEKLLSVFPSLRNVDFKITWEDSDGDHISITNDEDVITALTEMSDMVKVLHVNVVNPEKSTNGSATVLKIVCDVCRKDISGKHYKCVICADYDLCATCESEGHHMEHLVLRLPNSKIPFVEQDNFMHNIDHVLKTFGWFPPARVANSFQNEASASERHRRGAAPCTSNEPFRCPFPTKDDLIQEIISQQLDLLTMINKGDPSHRTPDAADTLLSDIMSTAADSFFANGDPTTSCSSHTGEYTDSSESRHADAASMNTTENRKCQKIYGSNIKKRSQQPTSSGNTEREMDWTILNSDEDSGATPNILDIQPPQDPRLPKGLAQLLEMGFSNDSTFLIYLLKNHNYDVSEVVKTIFEMH